MMTRMADAPLKDDEMFTWVVRGTKESSKNIPKWLRTMGIRRSDNHCLLPCAIDGRENRAIWNARIDGEPLFFRGRHAYISIDWLIREYPKIADDLRALRESTLRWIDQMEA